MVSLDHRRTQAGTDEAAMMKLDARKPGGRGIVTALALAALALPGVAAATPAASLYYERTVMREADGRCHLFAPEIAAALAASSYQARGAALRAGIRGDDLSATADRARTAAFSVACASPDLGKAAERVKTAFAGYANLNYMTFPGDTAAWQAERKPNAPVVNHKAVEGPRWRLSEPGQWQGASTAQATIGLAADPLAPVVTTTASSAQDAYSAFLIVRDPAKAAEPYIDPRRRDLAGRAPPRNLTRAFVAQARQSAPASLLPRGQGQGVMFAFPAAAAKAMEGLDPREAVTVEFVYPGRPPEHAVFEVGDFAAGRAFLMAGR
jgi:hypothetical protein